MKIFDWINIFIAYIQLPNSSLDEAQWAPLRHLSHFGWVDCQIFAIFLMSEGRKDEKKYLTKYSLKLEQICNDLWSLNLCSCSWASTNQLLTNYSWRLNLKIFHRTLIFQKHTICLRSIKKNVSLTAEITSFKRW